MSTRVHAAVRQTRAFAPATLRALCDAILLLGLIGDRRAR
jgi:hypothetical protein